MAPTVQIAMDLHRQGRLAEAEQAYRAVLTASPKQFEAYHFFGILKLQQGNLPEALTLIARAVEINPASLDTRSNLVAVLLNLGRHAEAIGHCDRILAARPSDESAHYHRGVALAQSGRHDEALMCYDRALAIKPDHVNALFNRAGSLASLDRIQEAIETFDRLLRLAPRHPDALCNRGTLMARLGRDSEALANFDQALAIAPNHGNALVNRGLVLKQLRRPGEALVALDRALTINPNQVEAHVNRGNVLIELHRPDEALTSVARALALAPSHPGALTSRAYALHALGRYQEARASAEEALRLNPQLANACLIRGHAFAKLDRPADAAASYEQALAIDPAEPFALGAALMAHRAACDWPKVDAVLPAVVQAIGDGHAVVPPFNLLGLPVAPDVQLRCARNFVRQCVSADPPPASLRSVQGQAGKIRLGYVSCDFRRHPVSYLIANLLERHDRGRFDVVGISYGPDDDSEERGRIVAAVDEFHDVRASDDAAAAALIERLQIDVAIDLAGHTDGSRPGILWRRPAPVQVGYLGYTGTIGAGFLDYVVGDPVALPMEMQPAFAERIVHLPDCFMVNDPGRPIAATPSRRELGLPADGFVFCCFNNAYKISADVFGVWLRLLARVDGSVLWLSQMNARAVANLSAAAAAAGVDPARIVFAARVPAMSDHLARQRQADLFLDTPAYNAHATSSDALWAGLPVLTCLGAAFPGRVAASLLNAIGLAELVTGSLPEYEAVALALARDSERLAAIRRRLDANRLALPLFDSERHRRHIEAAYVTMVERWRGGEEPRAFSVGVIAA